MNRTEYHRLWKKNNPEKVKANKKRYKEKHKVSKRDSLSEKQRLHLEKIRLMIRTPEWRKKTSNSLVGRNRPNISEKQKERAKKGELKIGLLGKSNHRWIEDRTKLKTERNHAYDTKYKYWMRSVKNRDHWKCKISNSDCSKKLEAHHILSWHEYPELRYEINNGITLCHFHHPRKRIEEKQLSLYFQSLILGGNSYTVV